MFLSTHESISTSDFYLCQYTFIGSIKIFTDLFKRLLWYSINLNYPKHLMFIFINFVINRIWFFFKLTINNGMPIWKYLAMDHLNWTIISDIIVHKLSVIFLSHMAIVMWSCPHHLSCDISSALVPRGINCIIVVLSSCFNV